jgi:site-specific DNA recombinase
MGAIVAYARTSTAGQEERHTVESQLLALRDWAKQQGTELLREYVDEGVSGSIPLGDRPAGARLLADAEAGQIDRIIIYCLDRLARDSESGVAAYNRLQKLTHDGVEFVVNSFDATPEGELQFTLFMGIAQYERRVIHRRMQSGRRRKTAAGSFVNSLVPWGYVRVDGRLEIDPEPAQTLQDMHEWLRQGLGLKGIAQRLNEQGVPVPSMRQAKRHENRKQSGWAISSVRHYLSHLRYTGNGTYLGEPAQYPPIIDEATAKQTRAILHSRLREGGPKPKHNYLLRGLLHCRVCGSGYNCAVIHGRPTYRCWRKASGSPIPHPGRHYFRASDLEERIKAFIVQAQTEPEALLADAKVWEERAMVADTEQQRAITKVQARLTELGQQRQRVLDLHQGDHLSYAEATERLAHIESDRRKADTALKEAQAPAEDEISYSEWAALLREMAADVLDGRGEQWELGVDFPARLHRLVQRIWVEQNGSLIVEGAISGIIPSHIASSMCS